MKTDSEMSVLVPKKAVNKLSSYMSYTENEKISTMLQNITDLNDST